MNEFVNFAVNYKPEVQNTATDALSRYPIAERHLREYSETCSADEVKATFDGAVNQSENNKIWKTVVNQVSATIREASYFMILVKNQKH